MFSNIPLSVVVFTLNRVELFYPKFLKHLMFYYFLYLQRWSDNLSTPCLQMVWLISPYFFPLIKEGKLSIHHSPHLVNFINYLFKADKSELINNSSNLELGCVEKPRQFILRTFPSLLSACRSPFSEPVFQSWFWGVRWLPLSETQKSHSVLSYTKKSFLYCILYFVP